MDECIQLLVDLGLAKAPEIVPATDRDLLDLDRAYPSLPSAYRRFLDRAGRGAGLFLRGTHAFMPEVLAFRHECLALAGQHPKSALQPTDVIIANHQGYSCLFLRGIESDPPVYVLDEREESPKLLSPRFTDWLRDLIVDEANTWAGGPSSPPAPED